MARPKSFDPDEALQAAISVFAQHGFEGTKTEALVGAMRVGRQSLYDSFGDKWRLYVAALRCYLTDRIHLQLGALRTPGRAMDGIADLVETVIIDPAIGCLGVGSICEFGRTNAEVAAANDHAGVTLRGALITRIAEAQASGDIDRSLNPGDAASFIVMNLAGLKVAARAGASQADLRNMTHMTLRSLR